MNLYQNIFYKNNNTKQITEQTSELYQGDVIKSVHDNQSQINNQNMELNSINVIFLIL